MIWNISLYQLKVNKYIQERWLRGHYFVDLVKIQEIFFDKRVAYSNNVEHWKLLIILAVQYWLLINWLLIKNNAF